LRALASMPQNSCRLKAAASIARSALTLALPPIGLAKFVRSVTGPPTLVAVDCDFVCNWKYVASTPRSWLASNQKPPVKRTPLSHGSSNSMPVANCVDEAIEPTILLMSPAVPFGTAGFKDKYSGPPKAIGGMGARLISHNRYSAFP